MATLLVAAHDTDCLPVGEIINQGGFGISGTITIVGGAIRNITELTVDGISGVQEDWTDLFEEQLENRVKDVSDLNKAVGDVARETISGVRQTATAVEGYFDDSLKDSGKSNSSNNSITIHELPVKYNILTP